MRMIRTRSTRPEASGKSACGVAIPPSCRGRWPPGVPSATGTACTSSFEPRTSGVRSCRPLGSRSSMRSTSAGRRSGEAEEPAAQRRNSKSVATTTSRAAKNGHRADRFRAPPTIASRVGGLRGRARSPSDDGVTRLGSGRCARNPSHRWVASIGDRTKVWPRGCPSCARNPPGRSFADRCPDLVIEWDRMRNRGVTPRDVSYGSHFRAWWRCARNSAHRWEAVVNERARGSGSGCPFCAGKRRL
jgi:hypothetical protein